MFDTLMNAMIPHKKEKSDATATISTPPQNDLTIRDVKENLPNFNLEPIEHFDTIDDAFLSNIILDAECLNPTGNNSVNSVSANAQITIPTTNVPFNLPNIHTQVNTINNMQIPNIPQMYFPHSKVTINYNFSK